MPGLTAMTPPVAPTSAGLQYKPLSRGRSVLAGGLNGIGAYLMALGAGQPQQAPLAFQNALQGFQEDQYRRQQQAQQDQLYGLKIDEIQTGKQEKADANAAAATEKAARDAAIDRLPIDDAMKAALKAGVASYGDAVPKPQGPQSTLAKLAADLKAGLISQAEYDAQVKKENYIAYPQGPQQPERVRLALEAGLKPGTPEYQQFLLGRDDTPAGPYQGTGLDQQSYNIVLTGDPTKPEYAAAYAQLAQPKVTLDPVTQKYVIVSPDMSWARKPAGAQSAPTQTGQSQPTVQVPGATITSEPGKPVYNEGQGKAAGFTDRMTTANSVFDDPNVSAAGQDIVEGVASSIPLVGNYLTSEDRQKFEQAERNFINAQLRRESGAVISPEEFAEARKQYIPQRGDGPEVLAQKKQNRQQAIDAMAREGGPFYKPPSGAGNVVDQLPPGFY